MWSTYLIQTRTGMIGPRISPKKADWSMTVNETEELDLVIDKSTLPAFESRLWLEPWWSGVLHMYDNRPIVAGPLISWPRESHTELSLAYSGIRALLAKRSPVPDMADWADLNNADKVKNWHYIPPRNTSYATIARNVVSASLQKQGGDLPIDFMVAPSAAIDDEIDSAGNFIAEHDRPHYRRFAGYEGLNNNVDVTLTDLSELDNGPDIMFRPVLKVDALGHRVVWQMWTGVDDNNPEIPQMSSPVWDTTSQSGFVPDLGVRYSGKDQTNRAFAISQNGSGGGSLIAMSQDQKMLAQGYPLLESMETFGGSDNKSKIQHKALTNLRANDQPRQQIEGTVRADGANPLGTFWPGDYGILVTKNWYGIRNDQTNAKILSMSGNLTEDISISFKEVET